MKCFSLAKEKKLRVCSTSLDQKQKEMVKVLVESLGGVFEEVLTINTKILIAGSVNSNKYRVMLIRCNKYFILK